MRQRREIGAAIVVAAVVAVTIIVVRRQPDWSLAGTDPVRLLVEALGAVALAAAGIIVRLRGPDRRSGALLIAAAAAWLIAEWNNPGATGAAAFTVGLLLTEAAAALVAHALLVHGRGRLRGRIQLAVVTSAYAGLLIAGGLGAVLVTDPGAHGCATCPPNLLRVANAAATAGELQRWGLRLGTVALALAAGLAALSLWQASVPRRRVIAPVVLGGIVYLTIVIVRYVHAWAAGWPGTDPTERGLRFAEACAFFGIAAGVVWQRLAARRIRHRLARIVVQAARAPRPGELRDILAGVLGDPTLELLHYVDGGWMDTTGASRPLPDGVGRALTSLVQDGTVVAVVLHRPGLLDDQRLVEELGNAARLALQHDRLQAQLRAQLLRLRESRTRAMTAADHERHQLERDLHDGAQQGLAALAMAIGLHRVADHGASAALTSAHEHIRHALDEVRAIAHGLYPAALADAGLAAALDVLSEWSPNLENQAIVAERFNPAVESTAYFVVANLTRATTAPLTASITHDSGRLYIDVEPVDTPDLAELEDRIGALDGRLHLNPGRGGEQHLRAELPCA